MRNTVFETINSNDLEKLISIDYKIFNIFSNETKYNLINSNNNMILTKLKVKIFNFIEEEEDLNIKLYLCLVYSNLMERPSIVDLNKIGQRVLKNIKQIQMDNSFVNQKLDFLISKDAFDKINLKDLNTNISLNITFFSCDNINKKSLAIVSENILIKINANNENNKDMLDLHYLMLNYLHKNNNFDAKITILMNRLIAVFQEKANQIVILYSDNVLESLKKLTHILLSINEKISHSEILETFIEKFGIDSIKSDFLIEKERIYSANISNTRLKQLLKENFIDLWECLLENEFIMTISSSILDKEEKMLLKNVSDDKNSENFKKNVKNFIQSSYFTECTISLDRAKIHLELNNSNDIKKLDILSSIKIFKDYLFILRESKIQRNHMIDLLEAIKMKRDQNKVDLIETTEILMYSKLYGEKLTELIKLLNGNEENLLRQICLATLGIVLDKVFNIDKCEKETLAIVEKIHKYIQIKDNAYIKTLIDKVYFDYLIGYRYEKSEVELFKKIINMSLSIGIYQPDKKDVLESLVKIPILKWSKPLRIEIIKYELNTTDDELIKDILCLEKSRGIEITQKFIDLIKNVEIKEILVKFITRKFKKNEWDLNNEVLDLIHKEIDTSKWIELIKEYDSKAKIKGLTSYELITQMKRLEGVNEINSYIKELLNRNEDGKCLIEMCLDDIDKKYGKCSTLFEKDNLLSFSPYSFKQVKLNEYDDKSIKAWTERYKVLRKENLKSIYCDEVTELIAIISRASEIMNGHQLRTTQKISLLAFINNILFSFGGRLVNISTGEGKSLITISTAISQILIKGGTVDILTSSEVLAERDANESKGMFEIFGILVSNNCDDIANSDEKIRKERYEKNSVIYGEIGHFQRDILLTKYYDKDIRKSLASCLIIDEVDSMCIDNMINTLYISHQIADLRYLKEIYCFIWQGVNAEDTSNYTITNVQKVKEMMEKLIKEKQINYPSSLDEFIARRLPVWINNAYIAKEQIEEGNHYSIMGSGKKIGEAVINDLQTGVEQFNTQWSEGLQQFIQLKHTNKLTEESLKAIFMSNYIFFKQYCGNIYGMTGTLGASLERDLLSKAYSLDFFQLPRFKKELNIKEEDVLVSSRPDWLEEIKKEVNQIVSENRIIEEKEIKQKQKRKSELNIEISNLDEQIRNLKQILEANKNENVKQKELAKLESKREEKSLDLEDCIDTVDKEEGRNRGGRAVLIICENKKDVNDIVIALLIKHKNVYDYNGKHDGLRKVVDLRKRTQVKINQVRPGDIIVATNVAGRGTDFKISKLLQENGGLHVIISYVPSNIRVELQGFGRSGRKGENGSGRMIAYDQRAKHELITMEFLKDERDEKEEERLQDIRIKMIPRVTIERELFEKFDELQKSIREKFVKKSSKYKDLQMKSLHNKWAYWLDKVSDRINNAYKSNENRTKIFEEYDEFEKEIREKVQRSYRGIQELIDEPGELIKLAKFNIEEGNFSDAVSNCDHIINKYGSTYCPFSYYYKALAYFKPLKNNDWDQSLDKIRRSCRGHIMTYEEKKIGINLLKKASILFEQEIEMIQMRSYIMSNISKEKVNSGVGSQSDYFTKSNVNEITALQVHLNAAKSAIGQDVSITSLAESFKNTLINEDEAKTIIEYIINSSNMALYLKKERFSQKIKIRYHVEYKNENENTLKSIFGDVFQCGVRNAEAYTKTGELRFLLFNNLDQNYEINLKNNKIQYSRELYINDRINNDFKYVKLPNKFEYCKNKILKYIQDSYVKNKTTTEREKIINSFKNYFTTNCLNNEKVWKILNEKLKFEPIKCLLLNKNKDELNKATNDENLWKDKIFDGKGEAIKIILKEKFERVEAISNFDLQNLLNNKIENEQFTQEHETVPIFINKIEKSTEYIIKKLIEENFLVEEEMFELPKETKEKIRDYIEKKIFLRNDVSPESLNKINLNDLIRLKTFKNELIKLVLDNKLQKEIKVEKVIEILANFDEDIQSDQAKKNAFIGFQLFKQILVNNGLAKSMIEHLNLELSNYDQNELDELENIIEKFYDLKYFKMDVINLNIDDLIKILKSERVIRDLKIKSSLLRGPESIASKAWQDAKDYVPFTTKNQHFIEELKKLIESLVKEKVIEIIDKRIEEDKFVTSAEIDDEHQKWTFRNTYHWIKGTELNENKTNIKQNLINKKKEKEIEKLTEAFSQSFINTIGSLKSLEMALIDYKKLDVYFKGTNVPKEVNDYILLSKDMVLSLTAYQSPWCWKAFFVAMWGAIQITLGALITAFPVLGPISLHFGSVLMSEGVSDILFAIQNAGNISGKSYLNHKKWSILISLCCAGIGSFLSRGANVASNLATQLVRQASKEGARAISKAVFKKFTGEIAKGLLGMIQNMVSSYLGQLITETIFGELKETIIEKIQTNHEYLERKTNLSSNLIKLESLIGKPMAKNLLNENFIETERELDERINNQILSFTNQIGGPLAGQIGEAAGNVQFSGLKLNSKNQLKNMQHDELRKVADGISIALKVLSYSNAIFEMITIVGEMLKSIDRKVKNKCEKEEKNSKEDFKNKTTDNEDLNVQEWMNIVDIRIFENISRKFQSGIITPTFNIILNYMLKPIYKKIEETLNKEFNELKSRALAYGEFNSRLNKNKEEVGNEYNVIKEFLLGELNKLEVFKSPIKEEKKIPTEGIVKMTIGGVEKVYDLSNEEDRNMLRDKIGSMNIRFLPGEKPDNIIRVSRPNYDSYLLALTDPDTDKQLNEFDLNIIAKKEDRPILIEMPDGTTKQIGPNNGKKPLYYNQVVSDDGSKHFFPMVEDANGVFQPMNNITNQGNKCGVETALYLKMREKFINEDNLSDNEADKKARAILNDPDNKIRETYLKEMADFARTTPDLYHSYVGRSHESSSIIGGTLKTKSLSAPASYISEKKKDLANQKNNTDQANSIVDDLINQIENENTKSEDITKNIKSKNEDIKKIIESKPDLGPISEKIGILEKEIEDLKNNLNDLKKDENTKTSAVLENKINQKKNEIDKIKQQNSELKLEIGKLDSLKNEIKELIKERNANKGETEFAHKNSSRQMTGKRPPVKTSINQNTVSGQTNLGQKDKTFRKGVIDALSDAQKLAKTIEKHKNNKSNIQVTGYRLNGDKMNIEGYYKQPNGVRTRFDYHVKVNPADKEQIQSTFRNSKNRNITQVDYNDILIRGSKK